MCNLYSMTKSQDAIRQLTQYIRDLTGNLAPLPAIFPNRMGPVVREGADGERELLMMRWGFPPPNIPGSKPRNPYLTNVRLVPATSFAEPDKRRAVLVHTRFWLQWRKEDGA